MESIPRGVQEKVLRARHHFDVLTSKIDAFMKDDSDESVLFVVKQDFDKGENIIRWGNPPPPPLAWSVILGEFFYDLRSALDHLARELILANDNVPKKSEFPIYYDETDFNDRPSRMTRGMCDEAVAIIKGLQPFNEWPEHPKHTTLWAIHDLCNIDKHNLLHLSDYFLRTCKVRHWVPLLPPQLPQPAFNEKFLAREIWLKPNTKIAHVTWKPAELRRLGNLQVQMDIQATFDVALAEWRGVDGKGHPSEGMPLQSVMETCLDYMDTTLLAKFERFF